MAMLGRAIEVEIGIAIEIGQPWHSGTRNWTFTAFRFAWRKMPDHTGASNSIPIAISIAIKTIPNQTLHLDLVRLAPNQASELGR